MHIAASRQELTATMNHHLDTQLKSLMGEINVTLLIKLQNIENLNLGSNYCGSRQIPKHTGSLSNLSYLNLSSSHISGCRMEV